MLKVAVDTKPPQQEPNNELTQFREQIQRCIKQELHNIGDVKIVDSIENGWVYYIETTFSLIDPIKDNSSQPEVTISAQIVSHKGSVEGGYHSVFPYTMNRLPIVCASFAELFNDLYLEKVRNERRKPDTFHS